MTTQYSIYGSGDPGSKKLCEIFSALAIPYQFLDIRVSARRDDGDPLKEIVERRLRTVPQVFAPDGELIGDFDAAISHVKWLCANVA